MATPKFKKSRANTRMRRSQWKADNADLQTVKVDGDELLVMREEDLFAVVEK